LPGGFKGLLPESQLLGHGSKQIASTLLTTPLRIIQAVEQGWENLFDTVRVTVVLNDTHKEVRSAANRSLQRFGEVISNPEVKSLVGLLRYGLPCGYH
jgi:hypothetical protein